MSTAVKEATAAFRVPGENRACGFRVTVLRATCQGDLPIGSQCAKANWQQLKRQRQRHNGPGALAEHRDFQLITGLGPGRLRVGCSHFQAVAPPAVPVASGSRVTRTLAGNYTSLVAPCHSAAVSGSESARMPVPVTVMEAGPRPVRAGQPRYRQDPEPEACPDRQPEDAGSRGTGGGCWPGAGRGRRAGVCQAAQRCQVHRAGPGRRFPPATRSPSPGGSRLSRNAHHGPSPAGAWSGRPAQANCVWPFVLRLRTVTAANSAGGASHCHGVA